MSLLLLGFLIGLRHALEADHLAAVAAMASQQPTVKGAARLGMAWGAGHTLTLFVVGSVVIFLDTSLPSSFALALELAVGVMLIALGVDVVRRMLRDRVHFHIHRHDDGLVHFHGHAHRDQNLSHNDSRKSHQHVHSRGFTLRAVLVGMVHGMAGSAALILLTLNSVNSIGQALAYMLLFGIGSMAGMAVLSVAIAIPLSRSARGLTWTYNAIQIALGIATIGIGTALVVEVGPQLV